MPEVYLRAVEALMLRSEEVCLVAAHNDDLSGARRCGLKTAFVARPYERGPDQKVDLKAESDWDVIARDMNELADAIGA